MDADEQTIPATAPAQTDCKTPRQKAGFLDSRSDADRISVLPAIAAKVLSAGKHTDGRTGEHGKLFCRFCHCITAGRSRACARAGTAADAIRARNSFNLIESICFVYVVVFSIILTCSVPFREGMWQSVKLAKTLIYKIVGCYAPYSGAYSLQR